MHKDDTKIVACRARRRGLTLNEMDKTIGGAQFARVKIEMPVRHLY